MAVRRNEGNPRRCLPQAHDRAVHAPDLDDAINTVGPPPPVAGPGCVTGRPPARTVPCVGWAKPAMRFRIVDFPHPLGPTRETNSPLCTVRLKSSRTAISSNDCDTALNSTAGSLSAAFIGPRPICRSHRSSCDPVPHRLGDHTGSRNSPRQEAAVGQNLQYQGENSRNDESDRQAAGATIRPTHPCGRRTHRSAAPAVRTSAMHNGRHSDLPSSSGDFPVTSARGPKSY